jgi:hypothetical protein
MLKLKAARINDEGGVMLFPDDVQHPKYVPRKTGMSMYCALHPTAVKALTNKAGG